MNSAAPRVDAHQHFWRLSRRDYRWLSPQLAALYRDFLPADLAPQLARAGVDATVVVQAADTLAESEFLLELAHATPWIAGVVGWVDLDHESAPRELERLARAPKFVGVRPMLQDLDDPRWVLRPRVLASLRVAAELGLRFDALAKLPQLASVVELSARLPQLRIVLDHAGKPALREGAAWSGWTTWRSLVAELARSPQCFCKFSGLLTEAAPGAGAAELVELAEFLRATFSAQRLMWGSDWPVLELAGDYSRWRNASEVLTHAWSADELAQVFGLTAVDFYGLSPLAPLASQPATQPGRLHP